MTVRPDIRLLSIGGIHLLAGRAPCRIVNAKPSNAVRRIDWVDALALRAEHAGTIEIECDGVTTNVAVVEPATMAIVPVDGKTAGIPAGERFVLRARVYDSAGRELEIGQATHVDWVASGSVVVDGDPSAGEFGFADGAFGMKTIRAVAAGEGAVEASFGSLRARLAVTVTPAG